MKVFDTKYRRQPEAIIAARARFDRMTLEELRIELWAAIDRIEALEVLLPAGDGVTDDRLAIQLLIDRAGGFDAEPGKVYVIDPKGA